MELNEFTKFTPKKDYFLSSISEPLQIPYLQFKADK